MNNKNIRFIIPFLLLIPFLLTAKISLANDNDIRAEVRLTLKAKASLLFDKLEKTLPDYFTNGTATTTYQLANNEESYYRYYSATKLFLFVIEGGNSSEGLYLLDQNNKLHFVSTMVQSNTWFCDGTCY